VAWCFTSIGTTRAARKIAGFSMEDLAKRLGGMVTKQAIGKYEKGLMLPARAVLERLLGTEVPFVNPLADAATRTSEDVETAATEVRRRWELGLGPIVNLLGVLEERGIRVFETSGPEGFEGLSGAFGALPFVAVSRDVPADRVRFTAARELAHVLCGFPERDEAEGACHAFAAAFLLPKPAA